MIENFIQTLYKKKKDKKLNDYKISNLMAEVKSKLFKFLIS